MRCGQVLINHITKGVLCSLYFVYRAPSLHFLQAAKAQDPRLGIIVNYYGNSSLKGFVLPATNPFKKAATVATTLGLTPNKQLILPGKTAAKQTSLLQQARQEKCNITWLPFR